LPYLQVVGDGDDLRALDAEYIADAHRTSLAAVRS
jgi:hypothetical protein